MGSRGCFLKRLKPQDWVLLCGSAIVGVGLSITALAVFFIPTESLSSPHPASPLDKKLEKALTPSTERQRIRQDIELDLISTIVSHTDETQGKTMEPPSQEVVVYDAGSHLNNIQGETVDSKLDEYFVSVLGLDVGATQTETILPEVVAGASSEEQSILNEFRDKTIELGPDDGSIPNLSLNRTEEQDKGIEPEQERDRSVGLQTGREEGKDLGIVEGRSDGSIPAQGIDIRGRKDPPFGQDEDQGFIRRAKELINSIRQAEREGLDPEEYNLTDIESFLMEMQQDAAPKTTREGEDISRLERLLTEAFVRYGSHLVMGRVDPKKIHPHWGNDSRKTDYVEMFKNAIELRQVEAILEELAPRSAGYLRLKRALRRYREIRKRGGWPIVPDGPTMKKGDRGERIAVLRSRLVLSGDLHPQREQDSNVFDEDLERTVRRFQARHGQQADGFVGPETLGELNTSVEERIRQIELNLERWRWLPRDFGQRCIVVNIPDFQLEVMENGIKAMSMRVIAGKRSRPTPFLLSKIEYLVLNPSWNIPRSIAVQDLLPKIQQDKDYLTKENIRVLGIEETEENEFDPQSIDWSRYTSDFFPFVLRQDPGPNNALGRIEFIFPSEFSVYIHDTPNSSLFERTKRDMSSGCIRVENAIELATSLLRKSHEWTREKILLALKSEETQTVQLPEPIPIYLLYWTAWVDEDETVQFREDVYGWDRSLDFSLTETPINSNQG